MSDRAPPSGIAEASAALRDGMSAETLLASCLRRISTERFGRTVLAVDDAGAHEAAAASDQRRRDKKRLGPLDGIPILVKDIFAARKLPTTAGSRLLEDYRPGYDATVVHRLRQAGAVIVGKANLDEFAMGSSGEHSAFGPVQNPWGGGLIPGGSSSGSAVSVLAGECVAGIASDTGGSIRQPSALCGVYGLRPSYGRVSRAGLIAHASSMDQAGPIARRAADLRWIFDIIQGPDPRDPGTRAAPRPPGGTAPLRVGLADPCVTTEDEYEALRRFDERWPHPTAACTAPDAEACRFAYYVLAAVEAASNLARFDGLRFGRGAPGKSFDDACIRARFEGFGAEVQRRIVLGTGLASDPTLRPHLAAAGRLREDIRAAYARIFSAVDLLCTPTVSATGYPFGVGAEAPDALYALDAWTVGPSLAGLPALHVPLGTVTTKAGSGAPSARPIGVQLIAPWGQESRLLHVAEALEAIQGPPPLPPAL